MFKNIIFFLFMCLFWIIHPITYLGVLSKREYVIHPIKIYVLLLTFDVNMDFSMCFLSDSIISSAYVSAGILSTNILQFQR